MNEYSEVRYEVEAARAIVVMCTGVASWFPPRAKLSGSPWT
jgi:hypothetical protein